MPDPHPEGFTTRMEPPSRTASLPEPTVTGLPRLLLRLEGACVLAVALWLYAHHGAGRLVFALLFLAPDLSMFGYLLGPRTGAHVYNAAHTYLLPFALAGLSLLFEGTWLLAVALIWTAHVGFDRLLGYGLKYPRAFQQTHLGRIGRR